MNAVNCGKPGHETPLQEARAEVERLSDFLTGAPYMPGLELIDYAHEMAAEVERLKDDVAVQSLCITGLKAQRDALLETMRKARGHLRNDHSVSADRILRDAIEGCES